MIEFRIRQLAEDHDGWIEVCLVKQEHGSDAEDSPEGETVGQIRLVAETAGGPTEWWDARIFTDSEVQQRRFFSEEAALVALAFHSQLPQEAQRLWGW